MGLVTYPSENVKVEVSSDGTMWAEVPGISDYTESGGEAPTREVVAFQGTKQSVGKPRPQTIELTATAPVLLHPTWKLITNAYRNNLTINVRVDFPDQILRSISPSGTTAAISAAGAVTFAGPDESRPDFTKDDFNVGDAIRIGNVDYLVVSAATATSVMVVAPSSGITATVYSIVTPPIRIGPYLARVSTAGNRSLASESDLSTSVSLAAISPLPDPVLINAPS